MRQLGGMAQQTWRQCLHTRACLLCNRPSETTVRQTGLQRKRHAGGPPATAAATQA